MIAATGTLIYKYDTSRGHLGKLPVGRLPALRWERRWHHDHPSSRRRKELLGEMRGGPLYSLPSLVGDALWLTTSKRLYLIATKPES